MRTISAVRKGPILKVLEGILSVNKSFSIWGLSLRLNFLFRWMLFSGPWGDRAKWHHRGNTDLFWLEWYRQLSNLPTVWSQSQQCWENPPSFNFLFDRCVCASNFIWNLWSWIRGPRWRGVERWWVFLLRVRWRVWSAVCRWRGSILNAICCTVG